MPKPQKLPATDRLREVVEARIAEAPFEFEGEKWAAAPQSWYRDMGFPPATLRRLISKAPFVRNCCHVEGKKTTLVRIGTPGEKTERHYVNILASIWRKKKEGIITRKERGLIIGLVQHWPKGKAIAIFNSVLDNWSMFAAGVKHQIDLHGGTPRYWKYPSLSVIRRFYGVAVETHMMLSQEKGKFDPVVDKWVMYHDDEAAWAAGEKAKALAEAKAAKDEVGPAKPTKSKFQFKFLSVVPKGWPAAK